VFDWTAPISDGGSPITGYKVDFMHNDGTTWTTYRSYSATETFGSAPISALKAAPYNLANGSTVQVRIIAVNSIGPSAPLLATTVLPNVPSKPAAPTTTISGDNVVIAWTAPSSDGGKPIT